MVWPRCTGRSGRSADIGGIGGMWIIHNGQGLTNTWRLGVSLPQAWNHGACALVPC